MKKIKKVSKYEDDQVYSTNDKTDNYINCIKCLNRHLISYNCETHQPKSEYSGIGKPPPDYDYTHSISVEDPRFELKPIQETPLLMRVQAVFSQDGNTMGTTEDYEDLTITMEYQTPPAPGNETEGFFTLETESGWSIDNPEEIVKLIESVKQAAIQIGKIKNESPNKKS
jgi:hypothetical protein